MTASLPTDATFAGYRLLRTLGSGSRAQVFLATGPSGAVALKVFSAQVGRDDAGTELDALGRVESPHLVRLLDVAGRGDEVPSLALEPVRRGSVAALLRDRVELERGEVVTLVAPIARLVTQLQRAGVAHGAIGAASVHLGDEGVPVLLGLGHARLFAAGLTPAALDDQPAAASDRRALGAFARTLIGSTGGAAADPRSSELVRWIDEAPDAFEFAAELDERLFGWAEAVPVSFASVPPRRDSVPARLASAAADSPIPPPATPAASSPIGSGPLRWLTAELLEDPFGELKRRATTWSRGVRKRYWIAVVSALAALLLALSMLPSGEARHPRVPLQAPVSTPLRSPAAAKLPDDPLLALPLLLRARASCLHDLSVLCLEDVDEASSEAFESDAGAIQRVEQGGGPAQGIDAGSVSLVERLGDSALLSLGPGSNPALILEIRTKVGWRIRDYLSGRPATSSSSAPQG